MKTAIDEVMLLLSPYSTSGRADSLSVATSPLRGVVSSQRTRLLIVDYAYQAAASGEVDVISAFSTDGRIAALDLVLVVDDKGVIPPYDAIVLASPSLASRRPEVIEALRGLSGRIDASQMQRMNYAVDGEGQSAAAVAVGFLGRG